MNNELSLEIGYPVIYSETTTHLIVLGNILKRPTIIPMWYKGHPVLWLYFKATNVEK